MKAVCIKEFKQYFRSITGYVFLAIFLFFAGYYFVVGNLLSQVGDISTFFLSIHTVVMFLLPLLTMRSFAEEAKLKTDQLLITSPLSLKKIVLGKFFAMLGFFATGLCVTLSYVAIIAFYGSFDILAALGNYTAMLLAAAAFIAIGIFISALTENQIVAAVLTYSVLMCLWVMDFLNTYVSSNMLKNIIKYCSFRSRFTELAMGIFSLSALVYYLSIILLFLFLTVYILDRRRWC